MTELRPETLDLTCDGCGYMLRGLDPAGVCPECGLAIGASIEAEIRRKELTQAVPVPKPRPVHPPLSECSPAWLRTVAAGLLLMTLVHVGIAVWAELAVRLSSSVFNWRICFAGLGIAWTLAGVLVAIPERSPNRRESLWWPVNAGLCLFACVVGLAACLSLGATPDDFERGDAKWLGVTVIPATFLFLDRVNFILSGSEKPSFASYARAARNAATVGAFAFWTSWPVDRLLWRWDAPWQTWAGNSRTAQFGVFAWFGLGVAFLFPLAAMPVFAARLLLDARRPPVPTGDGQLDSENE